MCTIKTIEIRNFEESEDELREEVADSMKNLFIMDDVSSDEAENTEVGGTVSGPPQVQAQVEDSGGAEVISSEHPSESSGESQTDNTS